MRPASVPEAKVRRVDGECTGRSERANESAWVGANEEHNGRYFPPSAENGSGGGEEVLGEATSSVTLLAPGL